MGDGRLADADAAGEVVHAELGAESASRMRTRVVSPRTLKVSASAAADGSVSGARPEGLLVLRMNI